MGTVAQRRGQASPEDWGAPRLRSRGMSALATWSGHVVDVGWSIHGTCYESRVQDLLGLPVITLL